MVIPQVMRRHLLLHLLRVGLRKYQRIMDHVHGDFPLEERVRRPWLGYGPSHGGMSIPWILGIQVRRESPRVHGDGVRANGTSRRIGFCRDGSPSSRQRARGRHLFVHSGTLLTSRRRGPGVSDAVAWRGPRPVPLGV